MARLEYIADLLVSDNHECDCSCRTITKMKHLDNIKLALPTKEGSVLMLIQNNSVGEKVNILAQ